MNNELIELAKQIKVYQKSECLSDAQLCSEFPGLGHTRSYNRILDGELEDHLTPEWATKYRQVLALINIQRQKTDRDDAPDPGLFHMEATRAAVTDAMKETGNNRLVIVEGPSGSGKTTAGLALAKEFGDKIIMTEADETWKDSLSAMLGGLLRAVGSKDLPQSADGKKTLLIELLKRNPSCIIIDEAHHLGPRTLNMVKTLLNATRCQFVFLCIPTLFRKLESAAYEEAKQLTHNRMCERIRLMGASPAEIEMILECRATFEPGALKSCSELLAKEAPRYGNFNLVSMVGRKCRKAGVKGPLDVKKFTEAMTKIIATR